MRREDDWAFSLWFPLPFYSVILGIIAALCLIGTTIDIVARYSSNSSGSSRKSTGLQCILAFSAYTNTLKWLSTKGGSDNLGCIHGIRFLSTCWVVLAHTWTTWIDKVWNSVELSQIYNDWNVYPIINGTVSVDTFFTVAGLLAAYNILKVLDKTRGRLNVPMLYLHRFLRLTPTYAILVGIIATLFEYMKPGPHTYFTANFALSCRKHWWHNLLYINNLVYYNLTEGGNGMVRLYSRFQQMHWCLNCDVRLQQMFHGILFAVSRWILVFG